MEIASKPATCTGFCAHLHVENRPAGGGDEGIVWPCLAIVTVSYTTSTADSQRSLKEDSAAEWKYGAKPRFIRPTARSFY